MYKRFLAGARGAGRVAAGIQEDDCQIVVESEKATVEKRLPCVTFAICFHSL